MVVDIRDTIMNKLAKIHLLMKLYILMEALSTRYKTKITSPPKLSIVLGPPLLPFLWEKKTKGVSAK